jgi:hypothetical protein
MAAPEVILFPFQPQRSELDAKTLRLSIIYNWEDLTGRFTTAPTTGRRKRAGKREAPQQQQQQQLWGRGAALAHRGWRYFPSICQFVGIALLLAGACFALRGVLPTEGDSVASAEAQYKLGLRYSTRTGVRLDLRKAMSHYRQAAEQGLAPAQFSLGVRYANQWRWREGGQGQRRRSCTRRRPSRALPRRSTISASAMRRVRA